MLSNPSLRRRPAFVIGDYADSVLIEVPAECPLRCVEGPCDVVLHALRSRKTGPGHALAVCRCHAHGRSFTVYPSKFVPFARRPLLDVARAAVADAPSFAAVAREAASGVAWSRVAERGPTRWWTTQTRLLRRLGCALGAFAGTGRDLVAVALGLPLRVLARVAEAVGYRARGRALVDALDTLKGDLDRVLLAGALAGCWGVPWRWERAPARLVPLVPGSLVAHAKASTTSVPRVPAPFS